MYIDIFVLQYICFRQTVLRTIARQPSADSFILDSMYFLIKFNFTFSSHLIIFFKFVSFYFRVIFECESEVFELDV